MRKQLRQQLSHWLVRLSMKPMMSRRVPIWLQRVWSDLVALFLIGPSGHTKSRSRIAGIDTVHITPKRTDAEWGVLYLHGGGYVSCSSKSHIKLAAWVGQAANAKVWLPEYRLAPEFAYPTGLNDAVSVYVDLLASGQAADKLIIAGDSAGGGLALATALTLKRLGLPMPAGLVLYSPWADVSLSGASVATHARRDAMLKPDWMQWCADLYRGNTSADDPGCSPLFADLQGLPPTLVHVGSEELLLSDSVRLVEKLDMAGVETQYQLFDGVGHVFQFLTVLLPDADESIRQTGVFIDRLKARPVPIRVRRGLLDESQSQAVVY